jgi:hypothetical protein
MMLHVELRPMYTPFNERDKGKWWVRAIIAYRKWRTPGYVPGFLSRTDGQPVDGVQVAGHAWYPANAKPIPLQGET